MSMVKRCLRSLLEAVFGGVFIYLIAFAALSTASPGSDGRAATLWSLLVLAVVLGVVVVVVGFRKRQPIVRAAGLSLLVAGGLFGNVIDTDLRHQAALDELEAKLPSAESMELKDRYQLFEGLAELVPKNPDYRAQRDQLKVALKEQEREQAAEKERVRIATEDEQRKKAREEACAKMSRSPDAAAEAFQQWISGAGKPGYKTPPPNFISNFVREQLTCYPDDEKLAKFLARLEAGAREAAQEEDAFRNPQDYLKLKVVQWSKGAGGVVAEADFRIQNTAPKIVMRDITIACNWTAPSGTIVSTKRHTIYDVVKAGGTRSFANVNLGFIDPQASRMGCSIVSAKPSWL